MDGVSAVGTILTSLGAAGQVLSILSKIRDAPTLVQDVLNEVNEVSACLYQLEDFLQGTEAAPESNRRLAIIESNCASTLSELKQILETLVPDARALLQRGRLSRWTTKKLILKPQSISTLRTRLQSSKMSLSVFLSTLNR